MTLVVHRSHRMERLVERLLEALREAGGGLLDPGYVVVQGAGMERWIAQEGARREGVYGATRTFTMRSFVAAIADALGVRPTGEPLDPDTLTLRIARHLPAVAASPDGAPWARYLAARGDGDARFELAESLAAVVDGYLVHRPELLDAWTAGQVADEPMHRAQAALVRAVLAEAEDHEAARVERVIGRLAQGAPLLHTALPRAAHVFGISSLAPLYLRFVQALGAATDVHLYVLAPSSAWMSDFSTDERSVGRAAHLLHRFGRIAREFQAMLAASDVPVVELDDFDDDPDDPDDARPATRLGVLQRDLRLLEPAGEPTEVPADDASIRVVSCHAPRRELEALHDALLARFEADPTLQPSDVVVMSNALDDYAALVPVVFGAADDDGPRIPFHVADGADRNGTAAADALLDALALSTARLTLPAVASLLARPHVAAHLGLDDEGAARVTAILLEAGARWGLSPQDRAREGQPPDAEHTFEHALERLAVGFAFGRAAPFGERLGCAPDGLSGGAELAAAFSLLDTLAQLRAEALVEAPLGARIESARRLARALLGPGDGDDDEVLAVYRGLAKLEQRADDAGFDEAVSMRVFSRWLSQTLSSGGGTGRFLQGGVVFCRMLPMRAIPFRVVCLLGMSDAAFPRRVERQSLDLAAAEPRPGDRDAREDDRQCVLDAILSARDALLVFYTGRDARTDAVLPVSGVIARMLEVVRASTTRAPSDTPDPLVVEELLHRFDPARFSAQARARGLVATDAHAFACAQAAAGERRLVPPTLAIPRSEVDAGEPLRLEALVGFVKKPLEHYLREVVRVRVARTEELPPEREPVELDALAGYALAEAALQARLDGLADDTFVARARAEGRLPGGELGVHAARRALALADSIFTEAPCAPRDADVRIDLEVAGRRLVGRIDAMEGGQRLRRTAGTAEPGRARVRAFYIEHLALNAQGEPRTSVLVGVSKSQAKRLVFEPLTAEDARARLARIVEAYEVARTQPVPALDVVLPALADADEATFRTLVRDKLAQFVDDAGGDEARAARDRALVETILGDALDGDGALESLAPDALLGLARALVPPSGDDGDGDDEPDAAEAASPKKARARKGGKA